MFTSFTSTSAKLNPAQFNPLLYPKHLNELHRYPIVYEIVGTVTPCGSLAVFDHRRCDRNQSDVSGRGAVGYAIAN